MKKLEISLEYNDFYQSNVYRIRDFDEEDRRDFLAETHCLEDAKKVASLFDLYSLCKCLVGIIDNEDVKILAEEVLSKYE